MSPQLHFLLLPLMTPSHMIPMTGLAKLLAQCGLIVTIITTPGNMIRYEPTIEDVVQTGLLPGEVITLEFLGQEAGLPKGCENLDSLPSMDLVKGFYAACAMLEARVKKLMAELQLKPSCIVSTNALPWTQRVADGFNIPRYLFETISCLAILSWLAFDKEHRVEDEEGSLVDQIKIARGRARATLVNSFEEMEGEYVEECRKIARTLWCIGPVNSAEKRDRGNVIKVASINDQHCRSWLDSKEPRSVIYACFGTLRRISAEQIKEIALGLEASGFAFIWTIRGLDCSSQVEEWLEGIEERVEGRGLIVHGWAPQVLILSHPSVGGFLTHCGWNSILEGVGAGVPLITWPMLWDQPHNEKFIVDVLKIGVTVGVRDKKEALVKWDQVKKSIEEVMDEEEEEREGRKSEKVGGNVSKIIRTRWIFLHEHQLVDSRCGAESKPYSITLMNFVFVFLYQFFHDYMIDILFVQLSYCVSSRRSRSPEDLI